MLLLLKKHFFSLIFVSISLLLVILLAKNPYSERNLIANLEPFPDAQYYTTVPRCFLSGQSWKMCRLFDSSIKGIKPAVPPAYSLAILPSYIFNSDVRNFYFINVLLALISLFLFFKISQNFFKNKIIISVILLFYVTNYYIYWYPSLAMAENLFLPLFLAGVLLMQSKISAKNSLMVGLVAAGFYATKYAYAPLTVVFPIIYSLKVLSTKKTGKEKLTHFSLIAIPAGAIITNLLGIKQILSVFNEVSNGAIDSTSDSRVTSGGGYFSISYFSKHIWKYSNALIGKSQRFLWESAPLVENWIALPGLIGLLASTFLSINFKQTEVKQKFSKLYLGLAVLAQLLFISTFYVVDIRYVYHFLPTLLLGFGFFLEFLSKSMLKEKGKFLGFIAMILIISLGTNAMKLKSVIMINLKYAETPWWYLSQQVMNDYFDKQETDTELTTTQQTSSKPLLITLASPFLTDNYSNQNYEVLPLDAQQDFRGNMPEVWGPNNYESLLNLYAKKITDGNEVYITNYGVNAASHFKQSYKEIEDAFILTKVSSGCYDLCNIYKLDLK